VLSNHCKLGCSYTRVPIHKIGASLHRWWQPLATILLSFLRGGRVNNDYCYSHIVASNDIRVSFAIAFAWMFHLILYVLPKALKVRTFDLFLNNFLNQTKEIPFLGVFLYALISCYLIIAVVKGVNTLGMRLLFIEVHPLR
jgi:uncharacterized membrane protein